jgi:cysteine desulfurase
MARQAEHLRGLERAFLTELAARQIRFSINGAADCRLPGACNIALDEIDADDLVERLASEIFLSTGSACSSGKIDVPPTLRFMGIDDATARSSIRVCFNRYLSVDDARRAASQFSAACQSAALATGRVVQ